jgi:2-polyprenyl-6-methoxyphenol hydroxylase-like FAD-dependent oxidoreductase
MSTDVLIVGAGPTGLVLALWLTRLGIRVRLIDKALEPGTTSRALVMHARTLELYRQLGLAEDVVRAGLEFKAVNLWAEGRQAAHLEFGRVGAVTSPFPFALIYPQDEHERFLIARLAELGVRVERGVELTSFEDRGDYVVASVSGERCEAAFLAGCDGAHSMVREVLGIGFPGGTYERLFYVADVDARGPLVNRELHVSVDEVDFAVVFPLKAAGRVRLIGTFRAEAERNGAKLGWDDVSQGLLRRLRVEIDRVHWFSTYRVHHRVASHFQQGRVFLLGDAAHIHSPVGGQGMNTGIGDAVNLAWKLAAVLRGQAPMRLLQSYEEERIAFARTLTETTDRAFQFITRTGRMASLIRVHGVPRLLSALFRMQAFRRLVFRTVSQTRIEYRGSVLSEGRAGHVEGGDRLPWVAAAPDNFTPLESIAWQVHVYGEAGRALTESCAARGLPLHVFPWSQAAARAGLARNASYLVRPDGYVALADPSQSAARLSHHLDAQGLRLIPRSDRIDETWHAPSR